MTLKDIVAYINLLDSLSIHAETQETVRLLDSVLHVVGNHSIQLDSYSKNLGQNFSLRKWLFTLDISQMR
jgi:hypothetical protein